MQISVVIPMYNAENTIIQALEGLESQAMKDFEVIVIDNRNRGRQMGLEYFPLARKATDTRHH